MLVQASQEIVAWKRRSHKKLSIVRWSCCCCCSCSGRNDLQLLPVLIMKWVFANAHESLPIEPWIELKSKRQKKANSIETIYTKLVQFAGSPRAWGRSARGTCNSIVIEQSEAWLIWTLRTRTHTCTHTHTPNKGQCHLSQCCSFDTSQLLSELHPSIFKRVFCYLSLYLYICTCTCLFVCVPVAACDSVCPVANALAPFFMATRRPHLLSLLISFYKVACSTGLRL